MAAFCAVQLLSQLSNSLLELQKCKQLLWKTPPPATHTIHLLSSYSNREMLFLLISLSRSRLRALKAIQVYPFQRNWLWNNDGTEVRRRLLCPWKTSKAWARSKKHWRDSAEGNQKYTIRKLRMLYTSFYFFPYLHFINYFRSNLLDVMTVFLCKLLIQFKHHQQLQRLPPALFSVLRCSLPLFTFKPLVSEVWSTSHGSFAASAASAQKGNFWLWLCLTKPAVLGSQQMSGSWLDWSCLIIRAWHVSIQGWSK